jgi:hypothetical protein
MLRLMRGRLEVEDWSFSGVWFLVFGVSRQAGDGSS